MMPERFIQPIPYTREEREDIKLRADHRTRCYIETLENAVRASASHVKAGDDVTRTRVAVMRALALLGE